MRVKVTFVRIPINVKESDPECLLTLFESTAYYAPVFPPTYRLHIEEMHFAFRREGYKINRTLFNERLVDIAPLPN
jgi:hypothetical protein|tara:strand:- start:3248 stop:3475 length:228 start_codon:yes stop_codon:yes gene_type:complete